MRPGRPPARLRRRAATASRRGPLTAARQARKSASCASVGTSPGAAERSGCRRAGLGLGAEIRELPVEPVEGEQAESDGRGDEQQEPERRIGRKGEGVQSHGTQALRWVRDASADDGTHDRIGDHGRLFALHTHPLGGLEGDLMQLVELLAVNGGQPLAVNASDKPDRFATAMPSPRDPREQRRAVDR